MTHNEATPGTPLTERSVRDRVLDLRAAFSDNELLWRKTGEIVEQIDAERRERVDPDPAFLATQETWDLLRSLGDGSGGAAQSILDALYSIARKYPADPSRERVDPDLRARIEALPTIKPVERDTGEPRTAKNGWGKTWIEYVERAAVLAILAATEAPRDETPDRDAEPDETRAAISKAIDYLDPDRGVGPPSAAAALATLRSARDAYDRDQAPFRAALARAAATPEYDPADDGVPYGITPAMKERAHNRAHRP